MTTATTTTAPKATKTPKTPVPCWCGCGGQTMNRFVPGHDARFHGWAKKVARGLMDETETRTALPHDEAREEFDHHVELARPSAQAWLNAEAEKLRKRAEKKAAADAVKDAKVEKKLAALEATVGAPEATETVPAATEDEDASLAALRAEVFGNAG